MADPSRLSGLRILVVEDVFLTADELAMELSNWGCEVIGPEGYVDDALKRIGEAPVDGALLDVNLHDQPCFEIALALASRRVPFIFLTGYDRDTAFPHEFQSSPRLTKPVSYRQLRQTMEQRFIPEAP